MPLAIGQILDDKYRIVRVIGVGGMGTVYEGEHSLIRRRVAIKVLAPDSSRTPDVLQRFERESQAAGQIGSDHILEVLDIGTTEDGQRYLVMEYLDGETLSARIERIGRLPAGHIALLARQILVGLMAAHDAGIVHRDLKPDNVFILREKAGLRDFVKIIDFGISKFVEDGAFHPKLTSSGAVLGTPSYMSPEQARGKTVDARSDLHSVGVILFEAVTGRVPFSGQNFNEMMYQIATGDRPRVRDLVPDLDPSFEAIIDRAMQRDPEKRYQSAREFKNELEAWMRANSLSTATGEIVLADVAAAVLGMPEGPPPSSVNKNAPTLAAPSRTVTNASVDTVVLPGRRSRTRWIVASVAAAGAIVVAMGMVASRRTPAPATASPSPSPSPASSPAADTTPSSSAAAPAATVASASPSASAPEAMSTSAPHAGDSHRKTKPAKGSPHPTPTGNKQVDFGY
ncbi:MAG TPA: serine/threonine-protein kinase [Polyangiaceae bacterium]